MLVVVQGKSSVRAKTSAFLGKLMGTQRGTVRVKPASSMSNYTQNFFYQSSGPPTPSSASGYDEFPPPVPPLPNNIRSPSTSSLLHTSPRARTCRCQSADRRRSRTTPNLTTPPLPFTGKGRLPLTNSKRPAVPLETLTGKADSRTRYSGITSDSFPARRG